MVLAFDSDEAGARAAERAYRYIEEYALQPVVLILPEGLDPADFVRTHGGDAFQDLAAEAEPLIGYMLRRTVGRADLSTIDGRSRAVADALPILTGLSDPVRQREYAHVLADLAGVSDASVLLSLDRRAGGGRPVEIQPEVARKVSARERVEREMLRLLARDTAILGTIGPRLTDEHFATPQHKKAFAVLTEAGGDVRSILTSDPEDRTAQLAVALALEPLDGDRTLEYAGEVWTRLQGFVLKRRSATLRERLQKLNPTTNQVEYDTLFERLISTEGELRRLSQHHEVPA
jgi:DNA primase